MTEDSVANIVSLSGGKDSTALALLAIEREVPNLGFVFADTGHEHPKTYKYVKYLSDEFVKRCGVPVTFVRADFSAQIAKKREYISTVWEKEGVPDRKIKQALHVLRPTNIPMLDLCLWKGLFPSSQARFCTHELKHLPIAEYVMVPATRRFKKVVSWQGVRRQESASRRALPEWDVDPLGWEIYRPILDWSADEVFDFHRKHGVNWNPLYEEGMGRVGCMPCIMARKPEIREIANRYPEEIRRVAEWEELVSWASKRGISTWFAADKTPGHTAGTISDDPRRDYGIEAVVKWSKTTRGGYQFDTLAEDVPLCSSVYGLCE